MRFIAAFGTVALVTALLVLAVSPGPLGEARRAGAVAPSSGTLRMPVTGGPAGSTLRSQPETQRSLPRLASDRPERRRPLGAQVLRGTALRSSPGGALVDRLGRRTVFDGPQVLAVVARRDGWLGVLHEAMPNGRAGWIRQADVKLWAIPYAITIDRSDRRAIVRRDGREIERFRVGIGGASSPTPTGRFAISDRLKGGPGSPYGCCIFALSGRQPFLPAGWTGGDRLAIHGTPDEREVGTATTAGCLNARASVLQRLMRVLPVGTPVVVRA